LDETHGGEAALRRAHTNVPANSPLGSGDWDGNHQFRPPLIEKVYGKNEGRSGTCLLMTDGGVEIEIPYIAT
jgi:hypothetical protein